LIVYVGILAHVPSAMGLTMSPERPSGR
jgi:hypothetical protein